MVFLCTTTVGAFLTASVTKGDSVFSFSTTSSTKGEGLLVASPTKGDTIVPPDAEPSINTLWGVERSHPYRSRCCTFRHCSRTESAWKPGDGWDFRETRGCISLDLGVFTLAFQVGQVVDLLSVGEVENLLTGSHVSLNSAK